MTSMTTDEELENRYEDALFTLVMGEYALRDGERLLRENERLKEDPDAALPADLDRRCRDAMDRAFSQHRKKKSLRGAGRTAVKILIIAAALVLLFTAVFAASPTFRSGAMNVLTALDDQAASWQVSPGENHTIGFNTNQAWDELNINIEGVPEKYKVSNIEEDRYKATVTYNDEAGNEIEISVFWDDAAIFSFDTEDYDYYEETTVHGYSAVIISKNDYVRIAWTEDSLGMVVRIKSVDLGVEEIKALAEGVIIG